MLTVITGADPVVVPSIILLVYGSPGVGKTSLAFTSEAPILFDFDRGAHRSGYRKSYARFDSWAECARVKPEDIASYRTVIVDTVGRCLDLMTADIVRTSPKMQGAGGALSLQGYGALKSAFATWIGWLTSLGKDVVLLAHDREERKGDDLIMRPDIQGSSVGEVFKRADGAAYMYTGNKRRGSAAAAVLDFNAGAWLGKNPAGFEPFDVPSFTEDRDFFARIIEATKEALRAASVEQQRLVESFDAWTNRIDAALSADQINALVADAATVVPPLLAQVRHAIVARANALGLTYRGKKGAGAYVETEQLEQPAANEPEGEVAT